MYGQNGIEEVTCTPYTPAPVRSLALIQADDIDYACKSTDRSALNQLFARRGVFDDILIVRRHLLTDTSIANIALLTAAMAYSATSSAERDQTRTAGQRYSYGKDIRMEELPAYSTVRLFNAMIDWGEVELPADCLHPVF